MKAILSASVDPRLISLTKKIKFNRSKVIEQALMDEVCKKIGLPLPQTDIEFVTKMVDIHLAEQELKSKKDRLEWAKQIIKEG
jgi:hypothetical protein